MEVKDDGIWKPVRHCSQQNEWKPDLYCLDIERDAILFAVEQFSMYLEWRGSFTIVTKHCAFDFMQFLYHHLEYNFYKFGELNYYAMQLQDYKCSFKNDLNSSHVLDHHCFDGGERFKDDDPFV